MNTFYKEHMLIFLVVLALLSKLLFTEKLVKGVQDSH